MELVAMIETEIGYSCATLWRSGILVSWFKGCRFDCHCSTTAFQSSTNYYHMWWSNVWLPL